MNHHTFSWTSHIKYKKIFYQIFNQAKSQNRTPITFVNQKHYCFDTKTQKQIQMEHRETTSILNELFRRIQNRFYSFGFDDSKSFKKQTPLTTEKAGFETKSQPSNWDQGQLMKYIQSYQYPNLQAREKVRKYPTNTFKTKIPGMVVQENWRSAITYYK